MNYDTFIPQTLLETKAYEKAVQAFQDTDEQRDFKTFLGSHPDAGDIIPENVTLADEEDSTDKTKETALFDFKTLSKTKDDKNEELGYVETGLCGLYFNSSVWPVYVIMLFIVLIVTGVINHWFAGWALCCCQ